MREMQKTPKGRGKPHPAWENQGAIWEMFVRITLGFDEANLIFPSQISNFSSNSRKLLVPLSPSKNRHLCPQFGLFS